MTCITFWAQLVENLLLLLPGVRVALQVPGHRICIARQSRFRLLAFLCFQQRTLRVDYGDLHLCLRCETSELLREPWFPRE